MSFLLIKCRKTKDQVTDYLSQVGICYSLNDSSLSITMLKFNPCCEVLWGWKLNPMRVFKDEAFGSWPLLDEDIWMKSPWLDSGGFKRKQEWRRSREYTSKHARFLSLNIGYPVLLQLCDS